MDKSNRGRGGIGNPQLQVRTGVKVSVRGRSPATATASPRPALVEVSASVQNYFGRQDHIGGHGVCAGSSNQAGQNRGGMARSPMGSGGANARSRGGARSKLPKGRGSAHLPSHKKMSRAEVELMIKKANQQFVPAQDAEANATAAPELDDDQIDEDMVVADTFADYKPAKLKIGKSHPDPVIETASMASILPPNITYDLVLPQRIIDSGKLSALQLEAITYACQQHEYDLKSGERSGYLIGDGAGVGKGRTISGIIYENWLQRRRKSIWISVSADLKYDSERDLNDIGAGIIQVHPLNKVKYGKITTFNEGVIFSTYSALIGRTSQKGLGKYNTRLNQLVKWCGKDFDGPIVFDECHRAKNLCPPSGSKKATKTGIAVEELQKLLPRARIVYASATGASEPRNMAYMTRLGIWGEGTAFPDFKTFLQSVERRGVGAMELVAMDMKLRGAYIARQLSFKGVTFTIEKVPLQKNEIEAYDDSVKLWVEGLKTFQEAIDMYPWPTEKERKKAVKTIWGQFWGAHQRFFKYLCIAAKVKKAVEIAKAAVADGKCAVIGLQSTGEARTLDQLESCDGNLEDFVSTAMGVFDNLVKTQFPGKPGPVSKKSIVDAIFAENDDNEEDAAGPSRGRRGRGTKPPKRMKFDFDDDEDDKDGILDCEAYESDFMPSGLEEESDGSGEETERIDSDHSDDDDDGFLRINPAVTKKVNKQKLSKNKKNSNGLDPLTEKKYKDAVLELKRILLKKIEKLGERLPLNTLDELVNELGGPDVVAEMTGRKGRMVKKKSGKVEYMSRAENEISMEIVNLAEKERFMKGDKLIAIISEAASSGISLQSDRRVPNKRRRVHITLELPWSADRAIQQFGRTHRSNQVNAPEYVFLISDLAGEHRFASVVAKRLESLGALTHGDRRATKSRDLSQFHIDNKYGHKSLESIMDATLKTTAPLIPPPENFDGNFFTELCIALCGVGLIDEMGSTFRRVADYKNMSKFLNRLLGVPVGLQNYLFDYFIDTLNFIVKEAKKIGTYDAGILDFNDSGAIERGQKDTYERSHATGTGLIELHELKVERGLSWEQIMKKDSLLDGLSTEGFYLKKRIQNPKKPAPAIFVLSESKSETAAINRYSMYFVYKPNVGMQGRIELQELRSAYRKVTPAEAKHSWETQYNESKTICSHEYWSPYNTCNTKRYLGSCDHGLRQRTYHVLTGAVLLVWGIVETVLKEHYYQFSDPENHKLISPKLQIVRVRLGEDDRIVGVLIPNNCTDSLRQALEEGAISCFSQGMGMDMGMDDDEDLLDHINKWEKAEKVKFPDTDDSVVELDSEDYMADYKYKPIPKDMDSKKMKKAGNSNIKKRPDASGSKTETKLNYDYNKVDCKPLIKDLGSKKLDDKFNNTKELPTSDTSVITLALASDYDTVDCKPFTENLEMKEEDDKENNIKNLPEEEEDDLGTKLNPDYNIADYPPISKDLDMKTLDCFDKENNIEKVKNLPDADENDSETDLDSDYELGEYKYTSILKELELKKSEDIKTILNEDDSETDLDSDYEQGEYKPIPKDLDMKKLEDQVEVKNIKKQDDGDGSDKDGMMGDIRIVPLTDLMDSSDSSFE